MYVNDLTLRLGDQGHAALERLFSEAHRRGLLESVPPLDAV
jgi:predicted solute-binding protein